MFFIHEGQSISDAKEGVLYAIKLLVDCFAFFQVPVNLVFPPMHVLKSSMSSSDQRANATVHCYLNAWHGEESSTARLMSFFLRPSTFFSFSFSSQPYTTRHRSHPPPAPFSFPPLLLYLLCIQCLSYNQQNDSFCESGITENGVAPENVLGDWRGTNCDSTCRTFYDLLGDFGFGRVACYAGSGSSNWGFLDWTGGCGGYLCQRTELASEGHGSSAPFGLRASVGRSGRSGTDQWAFLNDGWRDGADVR